MMIGEHEDDDEADEDVGEYDDGADKVNGEQQEDGVDGE